MKRKYIVTTFLTFFLMVIVGCDENNKDSGSLNAVLSVQESFNVPGRIELDPRGSTPGVEQKLVSFTIEVIDTSTGETVFGPETVSANSDSALLRVYFPTGEYLAKLTVTATTVTTDEGTAVRGTEGQITDTAEKMFSVDAIIAFPEAGSCEATCSASSANPGQTSCTLPTDCFTLDLNQDVLQQAQKVESSISENTTMWLQAYCGSGGAGTTVSLGGDGGSAGAGGFAQTITTVKQYKAQFGTTAMFYYLGEAGTHDDSVGTGGASTIVSDVEPQGGDPLSLDTLVLIAGGGGGGGEGAPTFFSGTGNDGGDGGFAYSSQTNEAVQGCGCSGGGIVQFTNGTFGSPSIGGGCDPDNDAAGGSAQQASSGNNGLSGFGGESGGSVDDPGPRGWINSTPSIKNNAGEGGAGVPSGCDSGGGGGGFGGGGSGDIDFNSNCSGGSGGGSYAAGSMSEDSDAPSTNPEHSGDGDVIIIFNTDPSM